MSSTQELQQEVSILKRQLAEATDTLQAIRKGEIDALVVDGPSGSRVYTLQTADHPYRVLVQQMNEGALVLSREGFVLHNNPRFGGLVRALAAELNARPLQHWIAPEDQEQFKAALRLAFAGQSSRLELSLVPDRPESARVPVMLSLGPLALDNVDGVCAIVTDLRERRQRENLKRAELMARSLMDHAAAAVVITSSDGRIVRANAAAESLAGRPVVSQMFSEAFPVVFESIALPSPADLARWPATLAQLAAAGSHYHGIQARMKDSRGEIVELQVSAGPFNPGEDQASGAVFTLADVTALRTSERRFRALAESIPQIVWTTDRNGRLDYCNSVGTDYFGMSALDFADAGDRVIHPNDRMRANEAWERARQTGQPFQIEYRLRNYAGEARWFLTRAVPIRDVDGQITQWFGTSTDVDAQKKIENDLRAANADLEHFAYAASHDFQEPLRMVTAYTQLLQREFANELQGSGAVSLRYVLEGSDRLCALLQNLLAYMQASRNPEASAEEIDCNEVLGEVIANLQIPVQQTGAQIRSEGLPHVVCPRIHMLELLQNLVNNAIKYRSSRPPEIVVAAKQDNDNWIFSVRDNGMGIAPQHQQNIFGVFKRLHGNNIPGSGIGLAICRRVVEQHHGRIWVESQLDRGSIFYFSLPARLPQSANDFAHA